MTDPNGLTVFGIVLEGQHASIRDKILRLAAERGVPPQDIARDYLIQGERCERAGHDTRRPA